MSKILWILILLLHLPAVILIFSHLIFLSLREQKNPTYLTGCIMKLKHNNS